MDTPDWDHLICQAAAGDVAATRLLYERTSGVVRHEVERVLGRTPLSSDVDDAAHDTWIKVLGFLGQGRRPATRAFTSWARRIAFNECISRLRKHNALSRAKSQLKMDARRQMAALASATEDEQAAILRIGRKVLEAFSGTDALILNGIARELSMNELMELTGLKLTTLKRHRQRVVKEARRLASRLWEEYHNG